MLAAQFGDQYACDVMRISLRTLQRYRERAPSDPDVAEALMEHKAVYAHHTAEWASAASAFLHEALAQMRAKLAGAELKDVAAALKIVGELAIAREVLADEYSSGHEDEGAQGSTGKDSGRQSSQESSAAYN